GVLENNTNTYHNLHDSNNRIPVENNIQERKKINVPTMGIMDIMFELVM
ncbi:19257_t:CDS:1, partial [Racocetra fulgida]